MHGSQTTIEPSRNHQIKGARSRLPAGFALDADGVAYAVARGVDHSLEFDAFVNYHQSKGTVMLDWRAAWRAWVGNAVRYGRPAKPKKPTAADAWDQLHEKLAARQAEQDLADQGAIDV